MLRKHIQLGCATKALNGVHFYIIEGEFVVVLGASRAGKSTILNILGDMDTATSGEVIVEGTVRNRLHRAREALAREMRKEETTDDGHGA